jgi:hypothetical protein
MGYCSGFATLVCRHNVHYSLLKVWAKNVLIDIGA